MPSVALVMFLATCAIITALSHAGAQPSLLQRSDGTTDTLSPLGGSEAIYSDAHGNKSPTHLGSGLPSHSFSSPHGAQPGTVTPFGTPTPPNLLTPAPLLPLRPKGMATPQPYTPTHPNAPGRFGPSGGRPGQ